MVDPFNSIKRTVLKVFRINPDPSAVLIYLILILLLCLPGCSLSSEETEKGTAAAQPSLTGTESYFLDPTGSPTQVAASPSVAPTEDEGIPPSKTPQEAPVSTPSPSPTPDPIVICKPIPSDYFFQTEDWIQAICQEKMALILPPVTGMSYLDYTSLTGRVAYTDTTTDQKDLWVYDYWAEASVKWLDDGVEVAYWAPTKNAQGVQPLAILMADGSLVLMNGPEQMLLLESGLEGSCNYLFPSVELDCKFHWAPASDKIAYLKNDNLYVVPVEGGQPRKLAENAHGISWSPKGNMIAYIKEGALFIVPPDASKEPQQITNFDLLSGRWNYTWAPEAEAIIVPGEPIEIVKIDGSDRFTPTRWDGIVPSKLQAGTILWSAEKHLLVYDDKPHPCDVTGRAWVLELSGDLRRILFYYAVADDNLSLSGWKIPGESVYGWGGFSRLSPAPEKYKIQGEIVDYQPRTRRMYLGKSLEVERTVFIREDTQVFTAEGEQLTTYNFKPWVEMPVEVVCQDILDEYYETCMATEIYILNE
jgi:hypothetical protein